jgi:hypothetical protein
MGRQYGIGSLVHQFTLVRVRLSNLLDRRLTWRECCSNTQFNFERCHSICCHRRRCYHVLAKTFTRNNIRTVTSRLCIWYVHHDLTERAPSLISALPRRLGNLQRDTLWETRQSIGHRLYFCHSCLHGCKWIEQFLSKIESRDIPTD